MSTKRELKSFWEQDGGDYHANIGAMRRAVTITRQPDGYGISARSYFPFTNEQYGKRFDNIYDAAEYSVDIIKNWVQSIFIMESQQPLGLESKNLIN